MFRNAKTKTIFSTFLCFAAVIFLIFSCVGTTRVNAYAADETLYCDDVDYLGAGEQISAGYDVYCDEVKVTTDVVLDSVPSYGHGDPVKMYACATMAGLNVVGYYDRWCKNLIPNFEPGVTTSSGKYRYYPDLGFPAVKTAFDNLYSLMKTNEGKVGTAENDFFDGLDTYIKNAGYGLSKTSFYKSKTTVDYNKLTNAINQGKVGIVLCENYNFIFSITEDKANSLVHVAQVNSPNAHIMMVYGYKTLSYYKAGVNVKNETFLYVCSSFGSAEQGFMKMSDYSNIKNALIMTIS